MTNRRSNSIRCQWLCSCWLKSTSFYINWSASPSWHSQLLLNLQQHLQKETLNQNGFLRHGTHTTSGHGGWIRLWTVRQLSSLAQWYELVFSFSKINLDLNIYWLFMCCFSPAKNFLVTFFYQWYKYIISLQNHLIKITISLLIKLKWPYNWHVHHLWCFRHVFQRGDIDINNRIF